MDTTKAVRVAKLEVKNVAGERDEAFRRWNELADICKQASNLIWQTWLVWHINNSSADKLRAWLNKRAEVGKQKAGKCPVQAIPKQCNHAVWAAISATFPTANKRTLTLLANTAGKTIKSGKASKGVLPKWSAILLCHEQHAAFTHSVPIPFDVANAKLIPPPKSGENFKIELRLSRIPIKGKANCPSVVDEIELFTKGRRVHSQTSILRKIVANEYKFCGSNLLWDRRTKKWYVHVAYQRPSHVDPDLDSERTAYLIPFKNRPFVLRLDDGSRRYPAGYYASRVGAWRRRILRMRQERNDNYKYSSAQKGRGRKRAHDWRGRLQGGWNNFVKRNNHNLTAAVVRTLKRNGIGKLVYLQPTGDCAEHRFLSTAGKHGEDEKWLRTKTSWRWHQVASMLGYKCQDAGIELETKQVG